MGQKVSPIGLRIGINKTWQSRWYADKKDFSKFLINDIKIREYLEKHFKEAAISDVLIERSSDKTDVIINTAKPGMVIGQSGSEIEKVQKKLKKIVNENIQISIMEIKKPNLNADLVAQDIAKQIENRVSFRVAQKRAIRNVLKAGAKGIKTAVSGRLAGADMARTEGYTEGTIPLHTLRADIDYSHKEADTPFGKIGVKVWIYKGEILPDKKNKGGNKSGINTKENKVS